MKKKSKHNKYAQTIDGELDLHGLSREAARRELSDFLAESRQCGFSRVRVIVGKGTHSGEGGGVLGPLARAFLNDAGLRYREAKQNDGGEGALIVHLKD
ncbi:MAG TPA: Smr/MutS family protein [Candidatus Paceibacterota bacterium]|nr:Smr/MutS family protein [Candidatus Paceibacterota bacterium]